MPVVISLAGDWDVFGRAELRRRLAAAVDAESCIVDLTGFHCGDATFLDELVYLRKVRKTRGRGVEALVVSPADAMLRKIFQLTKLSGVWPVYESIDAALAGLEATQPSAP